MKFFRIIWILLFITCNVYAQGVDEKFTPSGKPIVHVFGNAIYNIESERYDYNFTRAHLGYQYQFSPEWSAKVIIDRGRSTSVDKIRAIDSEGNELEVENSSKEGAYYSMYLKFASLKWRVNEKLTLEGGAILQNHFITQERFWGLRLAVQTFQDMYWKIPSSDLGFIAYYQLTPGILLDFALTNGEGPRAKQDEDGKVKIAGGMTFYLSNKIKFRGYYHNRKAVRSDLALEQMYSTFIGYQVSKKLRIGAEFNLMENLNYIKQQKSKGVSVYSVYSINYKTEYFVRFDYLNSNSEIQKEGNPIEDGSSFMAGISHSPADKVRCSLNYLGSLSDISTIQNKNKVVFTMEYKF